MRRERNEHEYQVLTGTIKHRTERAVLVDFGTGEYWVPLSQLSDESRGAVADARKDEPVDIEVSEWFVEQEGLR